MALGWVLLALLFLLPLTVIAAEDPLPKDWKPDLAPLFEFLEKDSEDGPITAIHRNVAGQMEIRDAELQLAYLKLWTRLSAKQQASLKSEQTKWLATRAKKAKAAATEEDDETLSSLKSLHASIDLTQKRIAELTARLDSIAGKPSR